jgi:hypothetical protein
MNAGDARTILKRLEMLHLMRLLPAGLGSILAQPTYLRDVHDSTENHTAKSKKVDGNSDLPSRRDVAVVGYQKPLRAWVSSEQSLIVFPSAIHSFTQQLLVTNLISLRLIVQIISALETNLESLALQVNVA